MLRTTVTALIGAVVGLGITIVVLRVASAFLGWLTAPRVLAMEHSVIYQTLVLGTGFGGLCGALVGLAGLLVRLLRDRSPSGPG